MGLITDSIISATLIIIIIIDVHFLFLVKPRIEAHHLVKCQPVLHVISGKEVRRSTESYHASTIEVQCLLNGEWESVHGDVTIQPTNDVQPVPITLPHSHSDTTYQLRIRKCYRGTPDESFSEIFEVRQTALGKLIY